MPGFDKTGPRGEGPLTGGGFGRCRGDTDGNDASQYGPGRRGWGRGPGGGGGGGRGRRNRGGGRGRGRGLGVGGWQDFVRERDLDDYAADSREKLDSLERENQELRDRLAALEAELNAPKSQE